MRGAQEVETVRKGKSWWYRSFENLEPNLLRGTAARQVVYRFLSTVITVDGCFWVRVRYITGWRDKRVQMETCKSVSLSFLCSFSNSPRECAILWIFRGSSLWFVIGIVSPSSFRFTSVQASSEELSLFSLSVATSEGLASAVMLLRCTVSSLESLL